MVLLNKPATNRNDWSKSVKMYTQLNIVDCSVWSHMQHTIPGNAYRGLKIPLQYQALLPTTSRKELVDNQRLLSSLFRCRLACLLVGERVQQFLSITPPPPPTTDRQNPKPTESNPTQRGLACQRLKTFWSSRSARRKTRYGKFWTPG